MNLDVEHAGPAIALLAAGLIAAPVAFDYLRNRLKAGWASLVLPVGLAILVLSGALLSAWHNRSGEPLVWLFGSETVDFGLSEFGVVFALCAATAMLGWLAIREDSWGRWVLALAAIAAFVIAGEELSWGQWIFHWSTPEPIAAVNLQQETNLHNLVDPRLYDIVYGIAGFAILLTSAALYFFGDRVWSGDGFLSRMVGTATRWLRGSHSGAVLTLSAAVLLQHELFEEYSEFVLGAAAFLFLLSVVHGAREPARYEAAHA